jgi:hypothetical protein
MGNAGAEDPFAGAVTVDDEDEEVVVEVAGAVATGPFAFDVVSATAVLPLSAAEALLAEELPSEQPVNINGRLAASASAYREIRDATPDPRSPCEWMNDEDAWLASAIRSLTHVACGQWIIGYSSRGLEWNLQIAKSR